MQSSPMKEIWAATIQPVQGDPANDVPCEKKKKKSCHTFSLSIDMVGAHADCHAKRS